MKIELAIDRIEFMAIAKAKALGDGDCLDPEFIDHCVSSAANMALLFVGASQEQMMQHLVAVRERMALRLAEPYGTEIAEQIAHSFVVAVARCKDEFESAAGNNPGMVQ